MTGPSTALRYLYGGHSLVQSYDGNNLITSQTFAYGNRLVSLTNGSRGSGNTFFYVSDGLGSTTGLTDAAGALKAAYSYDAWGGLRQSFDVTGNRRLFTGHEFDTETSLYYFGARYYDVTTGRFLTTDPAKGHIQQPASLHHYFYANQNPLRFTDPDGRTSWEELQADSMDRDGKALRLHSLPGSAEFQRGWQLSLDAAEYRRSRKEWEIFNNELGLPMLANAAVTAMAAPVVAGNAVLTAIAARWGGLVAGMGIAEVATNKRVDFHPIDVAANAFEAATKKNVEFTPMNAGITVSKMSDSGAWWQRERVWHAIGAASTLFVSVVSGGPTTVVLEKPGTAVKVAEPVIPEPGTYRLSESTTREYVGHEAGSITQVASDANETLVGTSRSQMRRAAEKRIASDPDHPLKFLLDESGQFKQTRGLAHAELINDPDLVQMGHMTSNHLGGEERVMLQSAWDNQWSNITIETPSRGGAVLSNPAVDIGGIAVHRVTAEYWERIGRLPEGTVSKAPTIGVK